MNEKATIYDYARFCRAHHSCMECPIQKMSLCIGCAKDISDIDEVNEKILNWSKEHPVKTRQDKFLEMFPNAHIYTDGVLEAKPCHIDENAECGSKDDCDICRSKYWLAEVEENV